MSHSPNIVIRRRAVICSDWDFTMIIDYNMDGEISLQELVLGGARTLNDVVVKPGGT